VLITGTVLCSISYKSIAVDLEIAVVLSLSMRKPIASPIYLEDSGFSMLSVVDRLMYVWPDRQYFTQYPFYLQAAVSAKA
jgi:hypothetical protein